MSSGHVDRAASKIAIVEEMIKQQKNKMLRIAQRRIPHITQEDLLQPQDYPELEADAEFRFEEGVLIGLESSLAALRASSTER